MLKRIIYTNSLAALFLLCSCEKEADIEIPSTPAKLVVVSHISPENKETTVSVKMSKPLYETSTVNIGDAVANADVKLSDGSNSVNLIFNNTSKYYTISSQTFPIQAGKTYYLTVSANNQSVSAETTVPSNTFPSDYNITVKKGFDQDAKIIHMSWTDITGESNYYAPYNFAMYKYFGQTDTNFVDIAYERVFINDGNRDGKELSAEQEFFEPQSPTPEAKGIQTLFIHCNKEYYLYHNSVIQSMNTDGNPFAEPVIIYTNIKGGLGVFSAYTSKRYRITYK